MTPDDPQAQSPNQGEPVTEPGPGDHNLDDEEEKWAMGAHLSGFAALLGIPFGNIIAPLVIWMVKEDEMPYAARHAKEALNFQIAFSLYGFVASLSMFILIGFIILPVIAITWFVLTIKASMKAKEGEFYEYPFIFRLVT